VVVRKRRKFLHSFGMFGKSDLCEAGFEQERRE